MSEFDAIVVGARIAGCAMAHQLALRGWRVALVERKSPPLGMALSVPITYQRGLARFRELGLLPVIEGVMPRPAWQVNPCRRPICLHRDRR